MAVLQCTVSIVLTAESLVLLTQFQHNCFLSTALGLTTGLVGTFQVDTLISKSLETIGLIIGLVSVTYVHSDRGNDDHRYVARKTYESYH